MSFTDISRLGFGGAGIPDVLPQAVRELQRRTLTVVDGAAANAKIAVKEMLPEDTMVGVVDLTTQVSVALSTITVVAGGFLSTVNLSGKKLLVCWCDKFPPVPPSMAVMTPYQTRVIADGALAYFPLNDPVGSATAKDLAGTRLGSLTGSVVAGVPGVGGTTAMQFMGSGSGLVEVNPPIPLVVRPVPFSIELWYWVATADINKGANPNMLCIGSVNSDGNGGSGSVLVWMTGSSWPMEGLSMNQTDAYMDENFESMVIPDQWHHLVGTYVWGVVGGVGGTLSLYRDGMLLSQREVWEDPDEILLTPPLRTTLGNTCFDADPLSAWYGLLQDVAFYQRELTPTEVAAHYALR